MVFGSISVIGGGVEEVLRGGYFTIVICWLALPIFASTFLIYCYLLFFGDQKPVTFTPNGFIDSRLQNAEIPWTPIDKIVLPKDRKIGGVLITLSPEADLRFRRTRFSLLRSWSGNKALFVGTHDLSFSQKEVWDLMKAYLQAYNPAGLIN